MSKNIIQAVRTEFNKCGPHPWYGDCDALGKNGECVECQQSQSIRKPYFWMWLDTILTNEQKK